jgi:hypothetical protein
LTLPSLVDTLGYMMSAQSYARTLLTNIEDLLADPDPKTQVRAVHHLAEGVTLLQHKVIAEARQKGIPWSEIGDIYGCTRQAAQQRFGGGD